MSTTPLAIHNPLPATGLALLAARINAAHREARDYATRAVERALEAGDLLLEVKATLTHGAWLPWLTQHCPDVSRRTAQGYMRLARDLPLEMRNDAHLTLNGAMRLLAQPKTESWPEPEHAHVASLETWMDTQVLWQGDYAPWVFLLDADGWTPEQIAAAFASNAVRHALSWRPPTMAEIAASLTPCLPERSSCQTRSKRDAEDLYRRALRYWLALFHRYQCEKAAIVAERFGRTDLTASLNGAARAYARAEPILPATNTNMQHGALTAALVDAMTVSTDTAPLDGWRLPIGAWVDLCLYFVPKEGATILEAAIACFAKSSEGLPLLKAWIVPVHMAVQEVQP